MVNTKDFETENGLLEKKKIVAYIFSKAMTSALYILSYFLSIFSDQNQWEYDDSTDHVSSSMTIKLPIFISPVVFLHDRHMHFVY